MRNRFFGFMAVAAVVTCAPVGAETLEETAAAFGAVPSVLNLSLSPGGNKLAYISSGGHSTETVNVVDFAAGGRPVQILNHADADSEISWCLWATDDRLVCRANFTTTFEGVLFTYSRLFALGDDGKNVIQLTSADSSKALGIQQDGGDVIALELAGKPGRILMTRDWVSEFSTGTRLSNTEDGLGVEEVDIYTGKRSKVEAPDAAIVDYTADETGKVRLKVRQPLDQDGYRRSEREYFYRGGDAGKWQSFKRAGDFYPVAVDATGNRAYGFVNQDGFDALAAVTLDGTATSEVLLARADADVDELIRIGRRQRVVGAAYATEKRQIAYLDPELKKLAADFQRALPGKPLINIVDASADESKLVLVASSDTDPGMTYFYDKNSRELGELLPLRRELAGRQMGEMKPVNFTAADGTTIPGYLTLPPGSGGKNLASIVLPHGGPNARDEWGFDWLVQFFVARGYAVLQPNFRGSAGYGDAWFGRNGFQSWRTAIGDVNDAGRWLVSQGIADPARLGIVGWSYGGYAALQSQVLDNTLYKAVVAIAPVTDLELLREESRNYTSFHLVSRFLGDGPHISEGSPARNAAAFASPVLMFHGTLDQNTGVTQSRRMKDRLEEKGKWVKLVEYDGRDHFMDDAWSRTNMLVDIGKFLTDTLGQ
ncbi:alpha/beta hydrolase family protein [Altererythrobacter fulvus]|uniref:alpha/beta hydrolase family protein n=1 Tax=Caenibius fulvus TaxID=2126012 RepID=UPI003018B324